MMQPDTLIQPNKWATVIELTIFIAFFAVVYYLVPASITFETIVIPMRIPFLLIFGWVSLRRRNMSWQSLGLQTPQSWRNTLLLGVGLGFGLQMAGIFVIGPITRQLTGGASQNLERFSNMADGNISALFGWLVVSWTLAAFGEELTYRGYLMNRLADLTGSTTAGWGISLLAANLLFGLVHAYQGIDGIILASFTGLTQGLVYIATRRNLWVSIICHGMIDTLGFTLIYILLQCCPGALH